MKTFIKLKKLQNFNNTISTKLKLNKGNIFSIQKSFFARKNLHQSLINNKENNNEELNDIQKEKEINKKSIYNLNPDQPGKIAKEKQLELEEKRINIMLKQFDSKEFNEYLENSVNTGMDVDDIIKGILSDDKMKKLSHMDKINNKSLKKLNKKNKKILDIPDDIDIDISDEFDNENNNIYQEEENFNKKFLENYENFGNKKIGNRGIGPERYEIDKLEFDEKGNILIKNKSKIYNITDIDDQSSKLNRTKELNENENFAQNKEKIFVKKNPFKNEDEEFTKNINFLEDKKLNIIDEENDFEKKFFDSFEKNKKKKNEEFFPNENFEDFDEDFEDYKNTKRNKKLKENQQIDFNKVRNLRKIKNPEITYTEEEINFKENDANDFSINKDYLEFTKETKKMIDIANANDHNLTEENRENKKRQKLNIPLELLSENENNIESVNNLKKLVQDDLNPNFAEHEKALQIEKDLTRLARVSGENIIDLKPAKDYYLKKKALKLAELWDLDVNETKHWYRKLKREEKTIIKALVQRKKFEQKKKLKKLRKQWTIENQDIIEVNYLEKEKEKTKELKENENDKENEEDPTKEKDDVKIPEHYKNISEFLFFGDDIDYLRHYKRTCRNIQNFFFKFLSENRQTLKKGIGKNYDISVSEVKMNRACTVVFVWYNIPKLDMEISKEEEKNKQLNIEKIAKKLEENFPADTENDIENLHKKSDELLIMENTYKKIELNLMKSAPYVKGRIVREVGLKYVPEIRFIKDNFSNEFNSFKENLEEMDTNNKGERSKKLQEMYITPEDIRYLKCLFSKVHDEKEDLFLFFEEIQNGETDISAGFDLKENLGILGYEDLLLFSEIFTTSNFDTNAYIYKILQNGAFDKNKICLYIEFIKKCVTIPIEKFEEIEKEIKEKSKQIKLEDVKQDKAMKNYLKKNKMTYEELNSMSNDINKEEAQNNYLMNFEYKIPGIKSQVINFDEIKTQGKLGEAKENKIKRKFENVSRKEYKRIKELKKDGKSKSQQFWDNLERGLH